MSEIHTITEVKVIKDKVLYLKFSNGASGSFNFDDFFTYKGILSPLKDKSHFDLVSLNDGTICWPNECDLCPDVLYSIVTNQKIYQNGKVVFDPSLKKDAWIEENY